MDLHKHKSFTLTKISRSRSKRISLLQYILFHKYYSCVCSFYQAKMTQYMDREPEETKRDTHPVFLTKTIFQKTPVGLHQKNINDAIKESIYFMK